MSASIVPQNRLRVNRPAGPSRPDRVSRFGSPRLNLAPGRCTPQPTPRQKSVGSREASVDYDRIAPSYNQRFVDGGTRGTAAALRSLAAGANAERILEVGCGTGHWLATLHPVGGQLYGLDLSTGMLEQADQQQAPLALVSRSKRTEAQKIARGVRYIELANLPNFQELFVQAMYLGPLKSAQDQKESMD